MAILDYRGLPIQTETITQPALSLTAMNRQSLWREERGGYLTPRDWERIRRDALMSNPLEFMNWIETIRDSDLHLNSILSTRVRAISGLSWVVTPASEKPADKKIAAHIESILKKPDLVRQLNRMIDNGLVWGFGCLEILWDKAWQPRLMWHDPRYFIPDQETGETLLLASPDNPLGAPLKPYKWVCHIPALRPGKIMRNGLVFQAIFISICKQLKLRDWLQFAEIYGYPWRIGRYDNNASEQDIRKLVNALADLGIDASAAFPKSMEVNFVETNAATGAGLFDSLVDFCNNEQSKLILGQTRSTDEQSVGLHKASEAGSPDQLRQEIKIDDARDVEFTINRDLIEPYINLHFGEQEIYPTAQLFIPEKRDLATLLILIEKAVPLGAKIPVSFINEAFGIPVPKEDEEILAAPQAPEPAPVTQNTPPEPAINRYLLQLNAAPTPAVDEILTLEALDTWQQQLEPIIDPIVDFFADCQNESDVISRIDSMVGKIDPAEVTKQLAVAAFKARMLGNE